MTFVLWSGKAGSQVGGQENVFYVSNFHYVITET